jgi:hypothetical protein
MSRRSKIIAQLRELDRIISISLAVKTLLVKVVTSNSSE